MARRKRLTPAQTDYLAGETPAEARPWTGPGLSPPPIAQVSGEASATSALQEVAEVLASARAEGRLLLHLPLTAVEADYLVRDRLAMDPDEMTALVESLRSHGQRTPIEVTEIELGRYGLISGWRRLTALAFLHDQTGERRFSRVLAIQRQPKTAGAAYVSMVEENEIRHGLSYYERARIAARAVARGVFASEREALRLLFANASRAKRSKIGSFLEIHRRLDGLLRFPAALPERLGLQLARVLDEEPDRVAALTRALGRTPAATAEQELALIARLIGGAGSEDDGGDGAAGTPLPPPETERVAVPVAPRRSRRGAAVPDGPPAAVRTELRPGVFLSVSGPETNPVLTLSGPSVDPGLRERLEDWLRRGGGADQGR